MSENVLAAAATDPATAGTTPDRTRLLLVGGGVLTAVVLGVCGVVLLGGDDTDALPTGVPPVAAAAVVRAAPSAAPAAALPAPFTQELGRNPFKALYVLPPVSATGPVSDPTLSGGGAVLQPAPALVPGAPQGDPNGAPLGAPLAVPVSGVEPAPAPAGGGAAAPAAPVPPPAPTAREYALVLREVRGEGDQQTARFTLDGRPTTVKAGETFGPTGEIRLLSLQEGPSAGQWTAVLQVGDGEPFDAISGQAVSVR